MRKLTFLFTSVFILGLLAGCSSQSGSSNGDERITIVFKHGRIEAGQAVFRELLDQFEEAYPNIRVVDEELPSSSDQQHQHYVISLEGKSQDFDVFSMDVIWVPEFSRAGWIRDITHILTQEDRQDFFPSTVEADYYEGHRYAVPWFIDAGLLYYRKDLLSKHNFEPPKTWEEMLNISKTILDDSPNPLLAGYVWQGKQYEGLICNVMEFIWGNGGSVLDEDKVTIDQPETREALQYMHDLIHEHKVSPSFVTTADEEASRRIFGGGNAIFMRNWPYAWTLLNSDSSVVKDKVGVTTLPGFEGHKPAATLGGWHLGVNQYSRHPEEAEKLIRFLVSAPAQKWMARRVGYKPTRKALYKDEELLREQPFLKDLYEVFLTAHPRPVTPYYLMFSQIMQPEFSAALTGKKSVEKALQSIKIQMEHLLK